MATIGEFFGDLAKFLADYISCVPWWLILIFAAFTIFKASRSLRKSKREANPQLKKYYRNKGIIWLIVTVIPVGLAILLYNKLCIPIWVFVVLAIALTLGLRFDSGTTASKLKKFKDFVPSKKVGFKQRVLLTLTGITIIVSIAELLVIQCLTVFFILLFLVLVSFLTIARPTKIL